MSEERREMSQNVLFLRREMRERQRERERKRIYVYVPRSLEMSAISRLHSAITDSQNACQSPDCALKLLSLQIAH